MFLQVSDSGQGSWATQRSMVEPSSAAAAELISVIADVNLDIAQAVIEQVCHQSSLFSDEQVWLRLRKVTAPQLIGIPGITPKKAAKIMAAIELGRRTYTATSNVPEMTDPSQVAELLKYELGFADREKFAVLIGDTKYRIIGKVIVSAGTADETHAHPREIFHEITRIRGSVFLMAHNHPSGNTDPSPADLALTRQFLQAAEMMLIPLLDHLILGGNRFNSLRQTTALWSEFPSSRV